MATDRPDIPVHVKRVAMRAGLQELVLRHKPYADMQACTIDDEQWPCETFRSALLNLQFERLLDVINIVMAEIGISPVQRAIIERTANASQEKGQG